MRLNPFASVETIRSAVGAIDGLRIVAPVKGRGLQTHLILRADDEAGFHSRRRAILSALLDAQQGRDAWSAVAAAERELLHRVGLFVSDDELPAEVVTPSIGVTDVRVAPDPDGFARCGFVIVPGVIERDRLRTFRDYYAALVRQGFAQHGGNGGEPRRWVLYNDPLARQVHDAIGGVVRRVVDEPLKPSFAYFLQYLAGAALERHRDRDQCAVTAVLQVDFDPEPAGPTPWPLRFVRGAETFDASLALGDLVVFRGTDIEHYRDTFTCGKSSTSVAFCFVLQSLILDPSS